MKLSNINPKLKTILENIWFWAEFIFYISLFIAMIGFVIYELSKPCDDECLDYLEDTHEDSYRL